PFLVSRIRPPPSSTLFPYTTLFRSKTLFILLRLTVAVCACITVATVTASAQLAPNQTNGFGNNRLVTFTYNQNLTNLLLPKPFVDRKSTRLNSSHVAISYAVFCLKK